MSGPFSVIFQVDVGRVARPRIIMGLGRVSLETCAS